MTENITAELHRFLCRRFPGLDGSLAGDTTLLDGGAVDSLGIIEIVGFLSERFGVEVDDDEFEPENFASLNAIASMVARKTNA